MTPTPAPSTATAPPATGLRRERAARGPTLGGTLAVGVVASAALPFAALLLALQPATADTVSVSMSVPASAPPAGPDLVALGAAIDAVAQQAADAGKRIDALAERAARAERVARLRAAQKHIARARDARRAAGQSGAALKGPFPVSELGDLADLELSETRWLITRDGVVVAPTAMTGRVSPARLATAGRDEDPATIAATLDNEAVLLLRQCVPFEPWCLVDIVPASPPPPPPAVDVGPLRALLSAGAAPSAPSLAATPAHPAPATSRPSSAPPWPLFALGGAGLGLAVVIAARLRRLGSNLLGVAWRLRAGLGGRPATAPPSATGELAALDAAVDEACGAVERLASVEADNAWRRARLEAAVDALQQAHHHGGVGRLDVDDRDDAATARVVAAVNGLLETLDARHRRIAMAMAEIDGTLRLVTPLSQRLLRLARLEGLPGQVADELASLGTSLGQRARRPQVLPGLLADLAPLAPPTASIVDVAAAVEPLGDEGARLAARQLEGVVGGN
jgi:hypothetical protein